MIFVQALKNACILSCYIQPGAKSTQVDSIYNDCLKIKISRPPVDDQANKELIKFLAKILDIKKTQISIRSGEHSRYKKLLIEDKFEYITGKLNAFNV
ncbi:MAG: YggU family protein [Lentisphaeria bacterium]|nr:DUF167 domain-containing protein [Lentisphaeria bacterium]NQZ69577.1 YggU family protein [Lentisphaeria bacterium]